MAISYEGRQSEKEERISQARRNKIIKRVAFTIAAFIVIAAGGWAIVAYNRYWSDNQPGIFYPEQGREHATPGTAFQYNSNPPTSGPHASNDAEWGVYDKELSDDVLIHNLEHGGIWISYKPGIDPEAVSKIALIAKEFGRKVIMAPRAANDADIALAAWTRLDKFSAAEFSEDRVRRFIKAYINRGPEFVP